MLKKNKNKLFVSFFIFGPTKISFTNIYERELDTDKIAMLRYSIIILFRDDLKLYAANNKELKILL